MLHNTEYRQQINYSKIASKLKSVKTRNYRYNQPFSSYIICFFDIKLQKTITIIKQTLKQAEKLVKSLINKAYVVLVDLYDSFSDKEYTLEYSKENTVDFILDTL